MMKHSSRQFGNQFSGFGHQSEKFSHIGTCIRRNFTPWGCSKVKWSASILDPNLSTISLTWITSFAFVFMFNLYQNRVQLWGWCTIYVISPKFMSSLHHCPVNLYHLLLRLKWGKSNLNLLIKWNFHWLSSILGTYWDHFCSDALWECLMIVSINIKGCFETRVLFNIFKLIIKTWKKVTQ